MSENENKIARTGTWAFEEIAERMQQPPRQMRFRGEDLILFHAPPYLGENDWQSREIDFVEQQEAVRIAAPLVRIDIGDIKPPQPTQNGILVETKDGSARAFFLRDGHITVEVFPHPSEEPLESPTGFPTTQEARPQTASVASRPYAKPRSRAR